MLLRTLSPFCSSGIWKCPSSSLASISWTTTSHHSPLSTQIPQQNSSQRAAVLYLQRTQINNTTWPLCQTRILLLHSPGFALLINLCIVLGFQGTTSGVVPRRWYFSHITCLPVLLVVILWCFSDGSFGRPVEKPRFVQGIYFSYLNHFHWTDQ